MSLLCCYDVGQLSITFFSCSINTENSMKQIIFAFVASIMIVEIVLLSLKLDFNTGK